MKPIPSKAPEGAGRRTIFSRHCGSSDGAGRADWAPWGTAVARCSGVWCGAENAGGSHQRRNGCAGNRRFRRDHFLGAFDLLSIVIWKANRAKSKVAKRLLRGGGGSLEAAARRLTSALYKCKGDKARLATLRFEWGLGLPMSSAILSVCWPNRFSVYGYRVCAELRGWKHFATIKNPDRLWEQYEKFLNAVRGEAPKGLHLRDCDRFLWSRSTAHQLQEDIQRGFSRRK